MKKSVIFKLIAIMLCLVMTFTVFASCKKTTGGGESSTLSDTTATLETESIYDDNGFLLDELPDDLDYKNTDFTIFTWSNQTVWEWNETSQSGDLINDSLYVRMLKVEERLNINIEIVSQPGEWNNRQSFIETLAQSVKSSSGYYDLVGQYTAATGIGTMQKLYTDLKEVPYIDLEKPWWPTDITNNCTINGKLYFTTGDITPTTIRAMGTVMANLDMAENLGINADDLYNYVYNHEWTMEKVKELTLGTTTGYNPDGTDAYGFTFNDNVMYDHMFYASGLKFIENDNDGNLALSDSINSEKMIDWYTTCQKYLFENSDVALVAIDKAFTLGNSLFHLCVIANVQNFMTDVDFKFAILPTPLVDEEQDDYYTSSGMWVTYYSVPTDAPDFSFSGAGTEALASDGYRRTTPTFYEQAFQLRYLETEQNAKMFDILHETLVFDTVRFFADQVKGSASLFSAFRNAATSSSGSWTTIYDANSSAWKSSITAIMDQME